MQQVKKQLFESGIDKNDQNHGDTLVIVTLKHIQSEKSLTQSMCKC